MFSLTCTSIYAQDKDILIANEYFVKGESDKAFHKYEELSRKDQNIPFIFNNYLTTLKSLNKKNEAEKFLRRSVKVYPQNLFYKLYLALYLKEIQDSKADKYYGQLVDNIKNNPTDVEAAADFLLNSNELEKTKELLLSARKSSGNKSEYAFTLSRVYLSTGEKDLMIAELLNYLNNNPAQIEAVKNNFQNNLKEKDDFVLLEKKLYELIQLEPDNITYNEVLLWINIQNKNFKSAYLQAKAIDKRAKLQGNKLIEVGRIALENREYDAAARYFQAVVDEYKSGYNYSVARRMLIFSKEEAVKNTYPVDKVKIQSLINDYKALIKEFDRTPQALEAMRSMGLLYGLYLDKKDSAAFFLDYVIRESRGDERLRATAKINLADIYLLKEEPWEASLLYSQVEKDMKEDVIGHEAKLKNARLAYYKGEFELAQAHLDILKMATTREIANDAMDLSILIQDNIGLDSNYAALSEFADIDLLLLQNKDDEALNRLNAMLVKFPGHSLTDEIYWQESRILRRRGEFSTAVEKLDKIIAGYPDGIYADEAFFTKAQIFEDNLKDKEKAMEIYKEFLVKYPGSLYSAEARKRFRLLRGDKI
jgi:predicted Zn-dependent protease